MGKTLVLSLLMLCSPLLAVQEYYTITRSVRALGMGNAFYAYSDDQYALFFNPATLSLYKGRPHVTLLNFGAALSGPAFSKLSALSNSAYGHSDVSSVVNQLSSNQGNPVYAAGGFFPYFIGKRFALGLLIADVKLNAALLGVGAGPNPLFDVTAISDSGLFLAWGGKWKKRWHVGMTAKAVYRATGRNTYSILDVMDKTPFSLSTFQSGGSGFTVDADFGAIYTFAEPWFGDRAGVSFVLGNVLGTYLISNGSPPTLPRTGSTGLYIFWDDRKWAQYYAFRLDLAEFRLGGLSDADFGARVGSLWKHVNTGFEIKFSPWFILRGGLHQGDWTAGIGIAQPGFHIDFATYAEELLGVPGALTSRRYALQLSLGFDLASNRIVFFEPTP